MRILIAILGSHGDTLPFMGLGLALQKRGHEVRLYGNGMFAAMVRDAGLMFIETSDARLAREALADPRATHPVQGMAMIAEGVIDTIMPTFDAMARDVLPGRTLIVGSTLSFASHLLGEARGLPFATVHLSPSIFRSRHLSPRLPALGHLQDWPPWVKGSLWSLVDRAFLDPLFTAPLNRVRHRLGLPPIKRAMHRWIHEAPVDIGMFPAWFAPPQPDWPAQVRLTGFPLFDTAGADAAMPAWLMEWLADGPPPIVFTAGTANTRSQSFYAESASACARLRCRGALVAAHRDQLPPVLPPGVIHVPYAPFSRLFARAAVAVHHGGIGTLSQALQAGVPQLIRPMAYDQFDNASRARRLGVAHELSVRRYGGDRIDRALASLMQDTSIRSACARVATQMAREDGLGAACDALLERSDTRRRRATDR